MRQRVGMADQMQPEIHRRAIASGPALVIVTQLQPRPLPALIANGCPPSPSVSQSVDRRCQVLIPQNRLLLVENLVY
jgi:hypothetical protein